MGVIMHRKTIAALSSLLFIGSAVAAPIEGDTSTVNFTGKITEATCALSTTSDDQSVDLGSVAANIFKEAGDTSKAKDFAIHVTDCDTNVAENASVIFSGETASQTALNVTGGATNVGIEILQDGSPLALDGTTPSAGQALDDGDNALIFAARYVALSDGVTSGDANATAFFTLYYE